MREDFEGCIDGPRVFSASLYNYCLYCIKLTSTRSCNVSSWLVARVAIVAILPNYSETHVLFGGFAFVAKQNRESPFFWKKNCNCWEAIFFLKNAVAQSSFCSSLYLSCKCISIWVGLFAGFTIAASCARAAPGSPEGKQAFSKIAKFKLQAFPKRTNPLLNPY